MRDRVRSNRKTTRGRRMYFQNIEANTVEIDLNADDPDVKEVELETVHHRARTVKHLQYSPTKIKIAEKILEQMNHKHKPTKCSAKTHARRQERDREVLEWNSIMKGSFKHDGPKLHRNDLCSCGSEQKYKKCCLNKVEDEQQK